MSDYKKILLGELILALGCTEPIAIALAAANAGALLTEAPKEINVYASGSVIKNANSVYVPNSGGLQGVLISAALGALVAKPELELRVLEGVTPDIRTQAAKLVEDKHVTLQLARNVDNMYIRVDVRTENHVASAVISEAHTRVSKKELDGETLFFLEDTKKQDDAEEQAGLSNLHAIYAYADSVSFEEHPDLKERLEQQIKTNMAIAEEGMAGEWGQQVGKTLLQLANGSHEMEAAAYAAAGSDARMAGCVSPVTINAGSGNQGITCSVPVIYMARKLNAPHEKLLRALVISNLIALYQKSFIGKLSAFCGAVSAAAGAGCGVAYLKDLGLDVIRMTLSNTLAAAGGIICDGAKGSCAMKIAVSLQNAFLGMHMAQNGLAFQAGDGIIGDTADQTVRNIGRIAAEGMVPTDQTILNIMTDHANLA